MASKYHHVPGTARVTDHELALLAAVRKALGVIPPIDGDIWVTPAELTRYGLIEYPHPGQPITPGSVAGLHQTAASLLRKRLLYRQKLGGIVHYSLTTEGQILLRDLG